jgi:hypothetical protein
MQRNSIKKACLGLALGFAMSRGLRADPLPAAGSAYGAAAPTTSAYPAPVQRPAYNYAQPTPRPTAVPRMLEHRWGFGLDNVPGATNNPISGSLISAPNAIALRWWATEKIGLDFLAALDTTSLQTGSSGSTGGSAPGTSDTGFGVGVGVKYNLTRPARDLLTQIVARVSTASSTQNDTTGLVKLNTTTMGLFLGAGFEAFIPGWDWLSLEGSAGFSLKSQTIKPDSPAAGGASQTTSSLSLGGAGFTPVDVAFHVYF